MTSTDFAAAQRRVVARRHARETAAKALLDSQRLAAPSVIGTRLPAPIATAWHSIRPHWDLVKRRDGTNPAFRVGQVDAELLDEELLSLLKEQVGEGLKYYGPHIRDEWSPEIMLALRAIIFKLTLWDHDASYGAALQNLRYTDARASVPPHSAPAAWQKIIYGVVSVGGRYAWSKWEDYLLDAEGLHDEPSSTMRQLSQLSSTISTIHSATAFASFIVFLFNGKYRTVLDRVLRVRLAPTTNRVSREVSFEYLNRQLVWHAFTEFLLFLLPLVGISRWKKWISRAWKRIRTTLRSNGDEAEQESKLGGELGFLPERTCAICYQDQNPSSVPEGELAAISASGVIGSSQTDVTNPYECAPCGCTYCFVCIARRLEAEDGEGWTCLRCGEVVQQCKPWNGDVMEEKSRSSSGKRVSFAEEEKHDEEYQPPEPGSTGDGMTGEPESDAGDDENAQEQAVRALNNSGEWARVDVVYNSSDEQREN